MSALTLLTLTSLLIRINKSVWRSSIADFPIERSFFHNSELGNGYPFRKSLLVVMERRFKSRKTDNGCFISSLAYAIIYLSVKSSLSMMTMWKAIHLWQAYLINTAAGHIRHIDLTLLIFAKGADPEIGSGQQPALPGISILL